MTPPLGGVKFEEEVAQRHDGSGRRGFLPRSGASVPTGGDEESPAALEDTKAE